MRTARLAVLVGLVSGLCACSSESPMAPAVSPDKMVTILTVRLRDTVENYNNGLFVGTNAIDKTAWDFGQLMLSNVISTESFYLEPGQTANVVMGALGAVGMESNGTDSTSFLFSTDWKAVEPKKHPGVRYNPGSEINFRVQGYKLTPDGDFTLDTVPTIYIKRAVSVENPAVTIKLPPEKNVVRFVMPSQLRTLGCSGSMAPDSLVLRSAGGIASAIIDRYSSKFQPWPTQVRELVAKCATYSSVSAARMAMSASFNRTGTIGLQTQFVERDGRVWLVQK